MAQLLNTTVNGDLNLYGNQLQLNPINNNGNYSILIVNDTLSALNNPLAFKDLGSYLNGTTLGSILNRQDRFFAINQLFFSANKLQSINIPGHDSHGGLLPAGWNADNGGTIYDSIVTNYAGLRGDEYNILLWNNKNKEFYNNDSKIAEIDDFGRYLSLSDHDDFDANMCVRVYGTTQGSYNNSPTYHLDETNYITIRNKTPKVTNRFSASYNGTRQTLKFQNKGGACIPLGKNLYLYTITVTVSSVSSANSQARMLRNLWYRIWLPHCASKVLSAQVAPVTAENYITSNSYGTIGRFFVGIGGENLPPFYNNKDYITVCMTGNIEDSYQSHIATFPIVEGFSLIALVEGNIANEPNFPTNTDEATNTNNPHFNDDQKYILVDPNSIIVYDEDTFSVKGIKSNSTLPMSWDYFNSDEHTYLDFMGSTSYGDYETGRFKPRADIEGTKNTFNNTVRAWSNAGNTANYEDTCSVTIIKRLILNRYEKGVYYGNTFTLKATVLNQEALDNLEWWSSDPTSISFINETTDGLTSTATFKVKNSSDTSTIERIVNAETYINGKKYARQCTVLISPNSSGSGSGSGSGGGGNPGIHIDDPNNPNTGL